MLGIQKVETALEAIKNTAIRNHIESAYTAALEIDKSGLKVAYHVACIKPLLEGNTDGLPTDFVKFAEQKLGLKKAQAYNMLMVGNDVEVIYDENGKNPIYIDSFTQGLIEERYDLKTQWKDYYKALKKAKTLGTTQLLTIRRMQTKYNFEDVDIQVLMDKGIINAGLTIKALETAIRSQFNAIETKTDETKTDETKTDEGKTEEGKTEEGKTEEGKTAESKTDITVPIAIAKAAYPVIARYAEESKELASLLHYLNGFPEIAG